MQPLIVSGQLMGRMRFVLSRNLDGNIQECSLCLYPTSHPFGLTIDASGVCLGCHLHQERERVDWQDMRDRLADRLRLIRAKSRGLPYDCVIPVAGTAESFFVVYLARAVLGLRPLLTHHNSFFSTDVGVRNLARLREAFDCDLRVQSVSMENWRAVARAALVKQGNIRWPFTAGQIAFATQTAIDVKAPAVLYGENQALEQVGMFRYADEVDMTRWFHEDHDLGNLSAGQLADSMQREPSFLRPFAYPKEAAVLGSGVEGIYLGAYFPWDHRSQQEYAIHAYNVETALSARSPDPYDHPDDATYLTVHDSLKVAKFGYGRVTDLMVREIRHGRIDRQSAHCIVQQYQKRPALAQREVLDALGLKPTGLKYLIESHSHREFAGSPLHRFHTPHQSRSEEVRPNGATCGSSCRCDAFLSSYLPPTSEIHASAIVIGRGR